MVRMSDSKASAWAVAVTALTLAGGGVVHGQSGGMVGQPFYPPLLVAAHDGSEARGKERTVPPTAASGPPPNLVVPASHRSLL